MLDLKRIRNNPEEIKELIANRGEVYIVLLIDEVMHLMKKEEEFLLR